MNAIQALEEQASDIAAAREREVRERIAGIAAEHDITNLIVRARLMRTLNPEWAVVGHLVDYKGNPGPEEIARDAQWYTGELIARWSEKLAKIGEGGTEIAITVSNAEMRASWIREGRKCSMVSRSVMKFNAQGTMFFQYPTRMKVDGASVTEAVYGEMFAK